MWQTPGVLARSNNVAWCGAGRFRGLTSHADGRHHATGEALFCAVRKEEVRIRRSVVTGGFDMAFQKAGVEELAPVCSPEIQVQLRTGGGGAGCARRQEEERVFFADGIGVVDLMKELVRVRELGNEVMPYVLPDGVRGRTDGRSYRRKKIRWVRTVQRAHGAYAALDDTGQRSAPTCMEGSNRTLHRIEEQNWNAIRCLNGEQDSRLVCHYSICTHGAGLGKVWNGFIRDAKDPDRGSMHLAQDREAFEAGRVESLQEEPAVSTDVFRVIVLGKAKVEVATARGECRPVAARDAADARGEAVYKSLGLRE